MTKLTILCYLATVNDFLDIVIVVIFLFILCVCVCERERERERETTLVVRVPGYRSRCLGSIPGTTRLSEK
jgi:hypothetical protein